MPILGRRLCSFKEFAFLTMREENFFYKGRGCFIVQTQPLNANYVKETLYGLTEEKMSL